MHVCGFCSHATLGARESRSAAQHNVRPSALRAARGIGSKASTCTSAIANSSRGAEGGEGGECRFWRRGGV